MRVTIISSRDGKIHGMAHCQLILNGNRYPDEAEIHASQPRVLATSGTHSREPEEFQSHIVELPDDLGGKGIEDLQKLAYLDTNGDVPMLRLHRKS